MEVRLKRKQTTKLENCCYSSFDNSDQELSFGCSYLYVAVLLMSKSSSFCAERTWMSTLCGHNKERSSFDSNILQTQHHSFNPALAHRPCFRYDACYRKPAFLLQNNMIAHPSQRALNTDHIDVYPTQKINHKAIIPEGSSKLLEIPTCRQAFPSASELNFCFLPRRVLHPYTHLSDTRPLYLPFYSISSPFYLS